VSTFNYTKLFLIIIRIVSCFIDTNIRNSVTTTGFHFPCMKILHNVQLHSTGVIILEILLLSR